MSLPPTESRVLTMRYAGSMVSHLGVQMYGIVGAIAELVANAWDADATKVDVRIPLDRAVGPNSQITITDNGVGMTFDECNDAFLLLGRNRRKGDDRTDSKRRKVMGRKGIGKLACFGVARVMEVRTIKDGWLTHFEMDYNEIIRQSDGNYVSSYKPRIIEDKDTELPSGTKIILKDLQLERKQDEVSFRRSMARRFTVLSDDFNVFINGTLLQKEENQFEFRYPEVIGENEENVGGVGIVRWWAGFMPKPIEDEEARGFVVMVRGKMAQAPFFFNLSGGTSGQHGMQYLTGEVWADGLDSFSDQDLVSTDRSGIRWDHPLALPLLEWGRAKVKFLLSEWAEERAKNKIDHLQEKLGETVWQRIQKFPKRERDEIMRAVRMFAKVPAMDDERFVELVRLLLRAYEDQHFMEMIRALDDLNPNHQDEIVSFLAEVNVLEAVHMASIIRTKVEVVRKFREMIQLGIREKPDMQDILRDNPWLIDPQWGLLEHERALNTLLNDYFNRNQPQLAGGRRVDFFCIGDSIRKIVVEVKRPKDTVGQTEIQQAMNYVFFLRQHAGQTTDPTREVIFEGYLIASNIRTADVAWVETAKSQRVFVRTWDDLLRTAEQLYGDYLDLIKSKAPADDPRIQDINSID